MGSYIAQGVAVAAPSRIQNLILVVSASHGETSSSARVVAEHADETGHLSPEQQQQWLAIRLFAPQTPPAVRQQVFDWSASRRELGLALTAAQVEAANDAVLGFDFRSDLPVIDVPTLVISGRHDVLVPPAAGAELARLIPGARFEVFEQSGHLVTFENPALRRVRRQVPHVLGVMRPTERTPLARPERTRATQSVVVLHLYRRDGPADHWGL